MISMYCSSGECGLCNPKSSSKYEKGCKHSCHSKKVDVSLNYWVFGKRGSGMSALVERLAEFYEENKQFET